MWFKSYFTKFSVIVNPWVVKYSDLVVVSFVTTVSAYNAEKSSLEVSLFLFYYPVSLDVAIDIQSYKTASLVNS